jgi:hypothetical protein
MRLQEWERDVINRQRNIVFPDTMLNEGRFYRNIVYTKAVYTLGQRIALLVIVLWCVSVSSVAMAAAISEFLALDDTQVHGRSSLVFCLYPLGVALFWVFVAVNGIFPTPARPRKRRGGYRQSGRG